MSAVEHSVCSSAFDKERMLKSSSAADSTVVRNGNGQEVIKMVTGDGPCGLPRQMRAAKWRCLSKGSSVPLFWKATATSLNSLSVLMQMVTPLLGSLLDSFKEGVTAVASPEKCCHISSVAKNIAATLQSHLRASK